MQSIQRRRTRYSRTTTPRRAVALVTFASMLVHLLFGCCWHHSHASEIDDHGRATACPVAVAETCGREHSCPDSKHDHGRSPCDHDSQGPVDCDGGRCVLARPPQQGSTSVMADRCLVANRTVTVCDNDSDQWSVRVPVVALTSPPGATDAYLLYQALLL